MNLAIKPLPKRSVMPRLIQLAHHHRHLQGHSEERVRMMLAPLLIGWISQELYRERKISADDWTPEGPLGTANKDWIDAYLTEALEGAQAVQQKIEDDSQT